MVIPDNEMHESIGARDRICDASDTVGSSSMHSLINMIPGQVTAIHQGLLNVGIRVRVGQRTDLRVRWPLGSTVKPEPVLGQPVKAVIPAEAVHLESGYFRLGKRRWNRWIGRITFVETLQDRRVVSVKLHHDWVTIKCCGSMTGSDWSPRTWDTVNVVVDPTKISLVADMRVEATSTMGYDSKTFDPFRDARIWLKAQVEEIAWAPEGKFLSLVIGAACISVFIAREDDNFNRWRSGMTLHIHVGRYDAWLKPCGGDSAAVLCGVLYLDSQSLAGTP